MKIFGSWRFSTIYKTDRPYDIWYFSWDDEPDEKNPTREWIIPKLKGKKHYRRFNYYLSLEELIEIVRSVRKTTVRIIHKS